MKLTRPASLLLELAVLLIVATSSSCGASAVPGLQTQGAATSAAAEDPKESGVESSITIVIPEDPTAFNGIVADTGYNQMVMELVLLGLTDIDPQGNVFAELAAELPTLENGGVKLSEEEGAMSVTWELRRDVTWADGEPLTADDVIFTWNSITDPQGGMWVEGVDSTDRLEKVDDYSFIAHYSTIYPNYLSQFGGENFAVFAEHYCDASQGFVNWNCNLKPLSSGPYILDEWINGDHMTFRRNPKYYELGKPSIEQIVVKIVPEKSVEKTMLLQGDADLIMWVTEAMIFDLQDQPGVNISFSPTDRWVMRLFMNQAKRGTIDAETTPHPAFADVRVRQAIRKAIDVQTIIDSVWYGFPKPVSTEFFRPPYVCEVPPAEYDPDGARELLKQAGWIDDDGDGVRECKGCANAEPGAPLSFDLTTYSEYGNELELTQQLIGEMLKEVGIDAHLVMMEGAVMWADAASGGTEQNGDFDINLWDDGYPGIDPTDFLWSLYHSESALPDNGWNVVRWKNTEMDAQLESVYTLDEDVRRESFCRMADILAEEMPMVHLFSIVNADAHTTRLQGIQSSGNDLVTWNVANWTLVK